MPTIRVRFTPSTASFVMYPGFTTSASSLSSAASAARSLSGATSPLIVIGPTC